jgi:glyoxylase-like metal-dependent hydrolase (beta-lactamase superfamily II)
MKVIEGDHCWGNQLLPSSTKIYAMKNCCDAISCTPINMIKKLPSMPTQAFSTPYAEQWFKKAFTSRFDHSTIQLRRPDIPLDESTTLETGGRKIELLYLGPAHTEGDMVAYVPDAKVLFAGDLLFFKGMTCERFL